ncbi:MAG TPA: hypothetical protein VKR06_30085 [Ktedonosporobacter sp.]|nr:hypothetical protein [Ktedonosporobacter sp.]
MGKETARYWGRGNHLERYGILIYVAGVALSMTLVAVLISSCVHTLPVHSQSMPSSPTNVAVETEIHDFALHGNARPALIVHNSIGFLHVRSDRDRHNMHIMVVKTVGSSGDAPDNIKVNYSQSDNVLTILVVHTQTNLFAVNDARADIDVVLPAQSDLQLQTGTGSIEVANIEGTMSLRSGTGTIRATGISLMGNSQLRTNMGGVSFQGSIHDGSYQFQSVTGNVDVTLPPGSCFHTDIRSTLGFFSSDFPGIVEKPMLVGARASGDIGAHPSAVVVLVSNTGAISLRRAK